MTRALVAFALCTASFAQTFEVASIRVHDGPLYRIARYSASGARVTYDTWPILLLIMEAHGLRRYQVAFSTAPSDLDTAYYDISAKAEGNAPRTRAEFRRMLGALLADRFHLRFHWEDREIPVYALVAGKKGPKFKPSAPDAEYHVRVGVTGRNQFIEATKATMEQLADSIPDVLGSDRPIVDRTGLTGVYDFRLEATLLGHINRDPDASDLSIFTAVQEQLGLKLEPQKAAIQVLVVDHIGKPSAN
ncbi:MAG: TIGR03435 family protein [Acidobacteria bacterium]|nr:TIGR03435 family protein [Acidobacteriota bacterium]